MSLVQSVDYVALAPVLLLALGGILVLLLDLFVDRGAAVPGWVAVVVVLAATAALPLSSGRTTLCSPKWGGSCGYSTDGPLTVALQGIVLGATLVVVLLAVSTVAQLGLPAGEFYFLLLASASGAVAVAGTFDLVSLIVVLELVSLPTFALVGLRRDDRKAGEAALKMFLFSVTSVAISLYGVALLYGATGTADRLALWHFTAENDPTPVAVAGLVMLLTVFAFKVAAVPFHAWAPDTYEGAPVPVAAYLSVVSKTAGFAGLVLVLGAFGYWSRIWAPMIAVLAAFTMLVGNVAALRQTRAVRLLAWSSIAQAGYVLVPLGAIAAGWDGALPALVAYLAAYAAMNLGAFSVVAVVARRRPRVKLSDFDGLAWRSPWLGLSLALFLAALAGLPPGLIGLFVKIRVLAVPVATSTWWLAAVMAVATVIGLAYYLSFAARLFRRPQESGRPVLVARSSWLAVGLTLAATVALSVAPALALGLVPGL
jgi:NADH-quinone oxidoreductase subunit N